MEAILTAAEMRAADTAAIARGTPSRVLMERAARAALTVLKENFNTEKVLFCCGSGNNGGDGLAMARFFAAEGGNAAVCYLGALDDEGRPDKTGMSEECARQLALLPDTVPLLTVPDLIGVSTVVDAVFGIGLTRPVTGRCREAFAAINEGALPVLALDIPSGINADSGAICGIAIKATQTVAIAARKYAHVLFPGAALCGRVHVADIGITPLSFVGSHLTRDTLSLLPPRPRRAHKGSFGRVLVVGGSVEMSGAAYLSAKAAYRAGAGIVEILTPTENRTILATLLPEAILTCYTPQNASERLREALVRANAVALGMGLGQSALAATLVEEVLRSTVPVVIDADALNLIAKEQRLAAYLQCRENAVLTPHLGELSRLCGKSIGHIAANMTAEALAFSRQSGAVVVLKDAHTVIADKDRLFINTRGNSGMATAGSGDVLSGITAALLAAGADVQTAAACGVVAHALAGDAAYAACGSHGLMASDIIEALCKVLP